MAGIFKKLTFKVFKKKVEDDVKSDTSGDYRKLLATLLNGNRVETNEVDMTSVDKDVDDLIASGIKRWGTDESKFNFIFGTRRF
jgi:annexin A7/11